MTLPDELRSLVHGTEGGWGADLSPGMADLVLAAADRIDQLEAAVDLARTEALHQRIEQLEAELALHHELERRVRSAPVYPGLGVEMALLALQDEDGAS